MPRFTIMKLRKTKDKEQFSTSLREPWCVTLTRLMVPTTAHFLWETREARRKEAVSIKCWAKRMILGFSTQHKQSSGVKVKRRYSGEGDKAFGSQCPRSEGTVKRSCSVRREVLPEGTWDNRNEGRATDMVHYQGRHDGLGSSSWFL